MEDRFHLHADGRSIRQGEKRLHIHTSGHHVIWFPLDLKLVTIPSRKLPLHRLIIVNYECSGGFIERVINTVPMQVLHADCSGLLAAAIERYRNVLFFSCFDQITHRVLTPF